MVGFDIAGGVAVLSVGNPPANVIATKVRGALNQALDRLTARSDLKALILCCASETFFLGADIGAFEPAEIAVVCRGVSSSNIREESPC